MSERKILIDVRENDINIIMSERKRLIDVREKEIDRCQREREVKRWAWSMNLLDIL